MTAKRSISIILLAIMLLLSSFVLFACGKEEKSVNTYKAYHSLMTEIKENTSLYSADTIEGIETKFYLNDFYSKDVSGNKIYQNNNYIILGAVSLEFIDEYYPILENLKLKDDYSSLKEDVKELKKSYKTLKTEFENLKNDATDLDYTIYNGYFSRYRTYAGKFINKSYTSAIKLGKFLYSKAKLAKTVATEEMTAEALEFYCDYNLLKVFDDLRNFFMNSCKGSALDSSIYNLVLGTLKTYSVDALVKKDYSNVNFETAEGIKDIFTKVNNERRMIKKANSKFSVYKFTNTYDESVEAYAKKNSYAPTYLTKINAYYINPLGTLNQLRAFILAL